MYFYPEIMFIDEWRRKQSLKRTLERRPDLLESYPLTEQEIEWLNELKRNG